MNPLVASSWGKLKYSYRVLGKKATPAVLVDPITLGSWPAGREEASEKTKKKASYYPTVTLVSGVGGPLATNTSIFTNGTSDGS